MASPRQERWQPKDGVEAEQFDVVFNDADEDVEGSVETATEEVKAAVEEEAEGEEAKPDEEPAAEHRDEDAQRREQVRAILDGVIAAVQVRAHLVRGGGGAACWWCG